MSRQYVEAYRRYCWPVNSVNDLKLAPFHILATEGRVHVDKDHVLSNAVDGNISASYTAPSTPRRSIWSGCDPGVCRPSDRWPSASLRSVSRPWKGSFVGSRCAGFMNVCSACWPWKASPSTPGCSRYSRNPARASPRIGLSAAKGGRPGGKQLCLLKGVALWSLPTPPKRLAGCAYRPPDLRYRAGPLTH